MACHLLAANEIATEIICLLNGLIYTFFHKGKIANKELSSIMLVSSSSENNISMF